MRRNIILTAVIFAMILMLTACGGGDTGTADAEAAVKAELDALKSENSEMSALTDFPSEISETMLASYAGKLRDFDYVISGSSESDDGSVTVSVNINTYDFGSVYLQTWNDRMKMEESLRSDDQFYTDLFTRFIAMSDKSYTGQADIVCTQGEDGTWKADVRNSDSLMNAISGGMVEEITALSEEDTETPAEDETEKNAEESSEE